LLTRQLFIILTTIFFTQAVSAESKTHISAELLYLRPVQDVEIAMLNQPGSTVHTTLFFEHDWRLGGRLMLNYMPSCSELNVEGRFTYFVGESNSSITAPAGGLTLFTSNGPPDPGTDLSTLIDIEYYSLDLSLGHTFTFSCSKWRPFLGFQALWIDQDFTQLYTFTTGGTDVIPADGDGNFAHSKYHALGVLLGLENEYLIGSKFRIFGRVAGSLVIGEREEFYNEIDSNGTVADPNLAKAPTHPTFGFDTSLGLLKGFCFHTKEVEASLSYNFIYWNDVGNPVNESENSSHFGNGSRSFSLHGVSLGLCLSF
jgi:hypothetical protein